MAVIFVPKESAPGETRVSAIPETVKGMTKLGLEVQIEPAGGKLVAMSSHAYVVTSTQTNG